MKPETTPGAGHPYSKLGGRPGHQVKWGAKLEGKKTQMK